MRKPIGLSVPHRKIKKDSGGWFDISDDEIIEVLKDHNMGALPHRIDACREIAKILKERNKCPKN